MDWDGLMRAGLQVLRLKPAEFWALTPGELMLMLGEPKAERPLGRAGLGSLMRAWPDDGAKGSSLPVGRSSPGASDEAGPAEERR